MSFLPSMQINLDAIAHNYSLCQKFARTAQIAAVVKNNAYGLGSCQVVRKLYLEQNCRHFFVAYATEGAAIRPFAPDAQIYLLNGFCVDDLPLIKKYQLTPVLSSMAQIAEWEKAHIKTIRPALQVETGLHRLGVSYEEAAAFSSSQRAMFGLILSHLASADEIQNTFNAEQCQKLQQFKKLFPETPFSLAASDGVGLGDNFHFDIIRAGAFLYGLKTCPPLNKEQKTVMTATAQVLQIKYLKTGDGVGYNQTFKAMRPSTIAALSVGYGDGIMRSLSGKGSIFFYHNDTWYKVPIIGRISMDITMCDVTDLPFEVCPSDTAFLLTDTTGLDDMAVIAGTIGYEVLSALGRGQRWIRKYKGDVK